MIISRLQSFLNRYKKKCFGYLGNNTIVPSDAEMSNTRNIFLFDNVNIGGNSILYATTAKIIIKDYFVSANGLRIVTGRHERRVGRF